MLSPQSAPPSQVETVPERLRCGQTVDIHDLQSLHGGCICSLKRHIVGITDIIREREHRVICIQVAKQNSPEILDTDLPVSAQPQGHTQMLRMPSSLSSLSPLESSNVSPFPFELGPQVYGRTMVSAWVWTKIRSQELECPENLLRC